jgi:hypothetical protein
MHRQVPQDGTAAGVFDRVVKQVIVAAPVTEAGVLNMVVGVNDRLFEPAKHRLLTAASCTTNCLAPVVKVLHEAIGIRHGQITTIHDPTNTNVVIDALHKDLRRARSAMLSLSPTSTGSATAIALIYTKFEGKLNGHAVRAGAIRQDAQHQPHGGGARVSLRLARCVVRRRPPRIFSTARAWRYMEVAGFIASWTIGYGLVQAITPSVIRRSPDGLSRELPEARLWGAVLMAIPLVLALVVGGSIS